MARFAQAATWIHRLLNPPPRVEPWLPLEQLISENLAEISLSTAARIEVDASPWGGGAVLILKGRISEWWALAWTAADAKHLKTEIGNPAGQTSWELLAVFLCLVLWGAAHRGPGIALLGDNLSSLEAALHLKGRGPLAQIARELSWRRAREGWRYAVGHLPTERNTLADALSRLAAPGKEAMKVPTELRHATRRAAPISQNLWTL